MRTQSVFAALVIGLSFPVVASAACVGDCNGDGRVRAGELTTCIARVLRCAGKPTGPCFNTIICGQDFCPPVPACCDADGNGQSAGDVTQVEFNYLNGCPASGTCLGDCDGNGTVSEADLRTCGIDVFKAPECAACDAGAGQITASEITRAIANVTNGCSAP